MPRRTSFSDGNPVASLPSTLTVPALERITPAIALSNVDFPAPLGPTIAVMAPRWARTLTPSTIGAPPYPAVRSATSRAAAGSVSAGTGSGLSVVIGRQISEIGVDDGRVAAQLIELCLRNYAVLSSNHHLFC